MRIIRAENSAVSTADNWNAEKRDAKSNSRSMKRSPSAKLDMSCSRVALELAPKPTASAPGSMNGVCTTHATWREVRERVSAGDERECEQDVRHHVLLTGGLRSSIRHARAGPNGIEVSTGDRTVHF